jgi:hypothetical protein
MPPGVAALMCLFGLSAGSLRGALFIYHTTADWFNKLEELGVSDRTILIVLFEFFIETMRLLKTWRIEIICGRAVAVLKK